MIKFGTDGWRALIARDFTFENLAYAALGSARYLLKNKGEKPSVVIGYDTRFLSREFAQEVAKVMAWQGITVHLCNNISSTPQVSFNTKQKSASLGVVITASHNPAEYSGYKVKGTFGGPSIPSEIEAIEKETNKIESRPPKMNYKNLDFYMEKGLIKFFDAKEPYLRYIKKKINIDAIKESGIKILYDPMYGAGINTIKDFLPEADEIHDCHNPGFGEIDHPEPIDLCLGELMEKVGESYDIGFATDGDADRLGAVDEDGKFVDSHKIYMIFLKYLYEVKKKKGKVVKTVSLTSMVDMYCGDKGIELEQTAVGFKYIAQKMIEDKVLIGGEESGGLSTCLHIPERDGIFNILLLLEIIVSRGKSLKELCLELDDEFGPHRYRRVDKRVTVKTKTAVLSACQSKPRNIGRFEVEKMDFTDGYKFFIKGGGKGGWLLIRASGTEPLLRFYAEAESMSKVNELIEEGMKLKAT